MNIIALTGNATKDIELKYGTSGTAIGSGTIAVRRDFKDKQTGEYGTDFINFTTFGKQSEIMSQYIRKGDKFGINGRLQIRTWDNDQGQRQYFTEVIVSGFDFPDKKNNSNNTPSNQNEPVQQPGYTNTPNQQWNAQNQTQGGYNVTENYSRTNDDPFSTGGGPIEVTDEDLPF